MDEQAITPQDIIDGQNKAIAVLGMRIAELTEELKRSKEYASHHVNAYHELSNKTENVGSINCWNTVWKWFQEFKPIQKMRSEVNDSDDCCMSASSLMISSLERYFDKFGDE